MLSDGVAQINCVISEQTYNKFSQVPKDFDVIEIKNFKLADLKGTKVLILMDPIVFVNSSLSGILGTPTTINKIERDQSSYNFDVEITIPQPSQAVSNPETKLEYQDIIEVD